MFERINDAQYVWYQMQQAIDDKEKFEFLREIAEHNAMFWNPEGVDQVRNAREKTFKTSERDFDSSLEDLFGRKMPQQGQTNAKPEDILNAGSSNPYLDIELDEVNFTPIRGD